MMKNAFKKTPKPTSTARALAYAVLNGDHVAQDVREQSAALAREFVQNGVDATQFHDHGYEHERTMRVLEFFNEVPLYIARQFKSKYDQISRKRGEVAANAYMIKRMGGGELQRRILLVMSKYNKLPKLEKITSLGKREKLLSELELDEIKELAHQISKAANQVLNDIAAQIKDGDCYDETTAFTYNELRCICDLHGIAAPKVRLKKPTHKDFEPAILRMICDKWWFNQLKNARKIMREHLAIACGFVSSKSSAYVSPQCLRDYQEQQKQNWEALEQMQLFDVDTEETFDLKEMVLKSVSNPAIRRHELMVRTRGCEDIANELGLHGLFVTMTTPSRFHSVYKKTGSFVPQWDGCSPRDAQAHLNRVWARIRAKLHRDGVGIFGVRVAEPHHDGTPHWHMLIWCKSDDAESVRDAFEGYATAIDRDELGDDITPRIDIKDIDPSKGSATGYIAKYISKNID